MKQKTGLQNEMKSKCLMIFITIPVNKALDVLIDQLNNDKDDLMKITKLCLQDIYELTEFCLSKYYFLWNNELRILKNSGPIALSFIVVLPKVAFKIWNKAALYLAPKPYRRYLDHTHAQFKSKKHSCELQKILNKQDKHIQFTIENENEENV